MIDNSKRAGMARPLSILDIVVIAVLIILAAVVIYFLRPLVIVLVIIGVGYFIYKWYKRRKGR
jgi:Flp pilus assembly protein TadB